MSIEFSCTNCGKLLRVSDESAGANCSCPSCAQVLTIPDLKVAPSVERLQRVRQVKRQDQAVLEEREFGCDSQSSSKVEIPCAECKQVLSCARDLLGTKGQCLNCKNIFLISTDPVERVLAKKTSRTRYVFNCTDCDQLYEGRREMHGEYGRCEVCGEVFLISLRRPEKPVVPDSVHELGQADDFEHTVVDALPIPTFTISCGGCSGLLSVDESMKGLLVACPHCTAQLKVP